MHRDSKGLPVQLNMKEDGMGQLSKHSPRPLYLSKSMDGSLGSTMNGKNDLPADLKESLIGLAKLRENPRYYSENQHVRLSHEMKVGSSLAISRDAPRYSYEGRAISLLSFEPRDFSKSNQRINDLPRLSLDSRESSMRSSSYDSNLAYLPTYLQNGDDSSNEDVLSMKHLSQPPSVVAKLMGLETLPDYKPYRDKHCGSTNSLEKCHHRSMPSKTFDLCRPIRLPVSPRSSKKDPTSPCWKTAEMRPISSSKCSNEPAPWRYLEGSRTSQHQPTRRLKSPESSSKSSPFVISEIEKRLKDLEFKQSRRQFSRSSTEASGSPDGSRRRPKSNILQQNADQLSEVSSETRNISSMGDDISVQSGGVATLEPMRDVEVASNKRSVDVVEREILSLESLKYPNASEIKTNSSTKSSCNNLVEELHPIAPEHLSPISVLDDSAYRENSPPPPSETDIT